MLSSIDKTNLKCACSRLAHSALGQHEEARNCFKKATELDPSSDSYKDNLRMSEQHLATNVSDVFTRCFNGLFHAKFNMFDLIYSATRNLKFTD